MENILNQFKNLPKGTKLYSPIVGEGVFDKVIVEDIIRVIYNNIEYPTLIGYIAFDAFGRLAGFGNKGERLLYFSKEDYKKNNKL
jgi:hypothetical protein